jgi:hypothetical protein
MLSDVHRPLISEFSTLLQRAHMFMPSVPPHKVSIWQVFKNDTDLTRRRPPLVGSPGIKRGPAKAPYPSLIFYTPPPILSILHSTSSPILSLLSSNRTFEPLARMRTPALLSVAALCLSPTLVYSAPLASPGPQNSYTGAAGSVSRSSSL